MGLLLSDSVSPQVYIPFRRSPLTLESTEIALIEPPCMRCGGDDFAVVLEGVSDWVWRKPGVFTLAACQSCGLVMTRPRPEDIGPYYEGAYAGDNPMGRFKRDTEGKGGWSKRRRMAILTEFASLDSSSHVLDVGCSHGGYLMHVREVFGCKTTGIDFDEASIGEAFEPENCTYLTGTLVDAGLTESGFDVVTFIECLEHDPQPLASLREAKRVVRPGGTVVVEVPNFNGFWRGVFGRFWLPLLTPQHMVHFTPPDLRDLMEQAGLEVVDHRSMNFPLEFIGSFWLLWCIKTGVPPQDEKPRPRFVIDLVVFISLLPMYLFIDVPTQWWLARTGRSGHMTVIGRKPA